MLSCFFPKNLPTKAFVSEWSSLVNSIEIYACKDINYESKNCTEALLDFSAGRASVQFLLSSLVKKHSRTRVIRKIWQNNQPDFNLIFHQDLLPHKNPITITSYTKRLLRTKEKGGKKRESNHFRERKHWKKFLRHGTFLSF